MYGNGFSDASRIFHGAIYPSNGQRKKIEGSGLKQILLIIIVLIFLYPITAGVWALATNQLAASEFVWTASSRSKWLILLQVGTATGKVASGNL